MQQEPIDGKPLAKPGDQALLDAYYQEPVKQAERFADLAKELFKLELAIPGIYAAALRVVGGDQSVSRIEVFDRICVLDIRPDIDVAGDFPAQVQGLGECCSLRPADARPRLAEHRGVFSAEYAG